MISRPSDLQSGPYHTELSGFLLRWKITIELVNGSGVCVCLDREVPITKETL